jgi:molecular chaperone DnaK (HSP70)
VAHTNSTHRPLSKMAAYDSWGSAAERFDGSMCLGVDLGTTNSCVGVWMVDRNHVKILKNRADRGRTTPSVVRFDPDSQRVDVGSAAVTQETCPPVGNTIRSVKRLMGQKFDSKAVEVARMYASYKVVPTKQQNVAVQVVRGGSKAAVQPEEVSAAVLAELKASAEAYFDGQTKLDNVVITVPAYFSDSQRKATITSASMAGFKAVRLLNEPTAAAMAYGLFLSGTKRVTVFDFGGGTLDVSLLSIQDGKFEVLGIGGDTNLGGEDINNLLVDHLLEVLYKHHDVTRAQVGEADMVRLKRAVEKAKIELSEEDYADISVQEIAGVSKFTYTLMRRKFEQLCDPIWKKYVVELRDGASSCQVYLEVCLSL